MFTGLIAYNGAVEDVLQHSHGGARLRIRCEGVAAEHPEVKDSIAVNGVCLTAATVDGDRIDFEIVPETLERSALGSLQPGDRVNLEYSLRLGDRMGGHFVYGHVDATTAVAARTSEGQGIRLRVERPRALAPMLVEKAFVAIDGVSVTIAAVDDVGGTFDIALIPETLARTTLGTRDAGDRVNIEVDPIARYAQARPGARP
jgi:riboflavin synthase